MRRRLFQLQLQLQLTWTPQFALCAGLMIAATSSTTARSQSEELQASTLFERLTGTPLASTDPRRSAMADYLRRGQSQAAAAIATDDPSFYNVTLRNFVADMSSRTRSAYEGFNDLQALIIGITRDDIDARLMLQGNFRYESNAGTNFNTPSTFSNAHYEEIDTQNQNLKEVLQQRQPQWDGDFPDAAGALSTRAWGAAHMDAGTNRRALQFAMEVFLCSPITQWRDILAPEFKIRRDVDRAPGGDASVFQHECRGCHGPMDGLAGAFARFDFVAGVFQYFPEPVAKVKRNAHNYPEGHEPLDDSWINYANARHNIALGWRGPQSGQGLNELGVMLSNSKAFSHCMTTKVFETACKRSPLDDEQPLIDSLTTDFENSGYLLKGHFERIATLPQCTDTQHQNFTPTVKNFREQIHTFAELTGVDRQLPEIRQYLATAPTRLSDRGEVEDMKPPTVLTTAAIAGLFCRRMISQDARISDHASRRPPHRTIDFTAGPSRIDTTEVIDAYARMFWQRDPTAAEHNLLVNSWQDLMQGRTDDFRQTRNMLLYTCTTIGGSPETMVH